MTTHLTDLEVEAWISGTLEPEAAVAHEAHARACSSCEARLQHEARVETLLGEAARAASVPRLGARVRWVVAVPLALAAGLALTFLGRSGSPASTSSDAGVSLSVDDTHFEGEAPPPEALTARAPFAL